MNKQNKENLEKLFGKFFNKQKAKEAAREITKAEQLLRDNRAPEPDKELVAKIKWQIAEGVQRKQRAMRSLAYKAIAVAAVIFIIATINLRFLYFFNCFEI